VIGLAAAALSIAALPGSAGAYPPQPPTRSIAAEAMTTVCDDEALYISYDISTQGFDAEEIAGLTATMTVLDSAGDVVEGPLAGQPLVGRLPYPGDSTDVDLLSGLRVKAVVVNSELIAPVQYPAGVEDCISPAGASSPPAPQGVAGASGSLPQTGGSDTARMLWIAMGALLAGLVISAASFRRHGAATSDN
jgi:hypothetical protein